MNACAKRSTSIERHQLAVKTTRTRLCHGTLAHREDGRDPLETALLGRVDDEKTDELAETGRGCCRHVCIKCCCRHVCIKPVDESHVPARSHAFKHTHVSGTDCMCADVRCDSHRHSCDSFSCDKLACHLLYFAGSMFIYVAT